MFQGRECDTQGANVNHKFIDYTAVIAAVHRLRLRGDCLGSPGHESSARPAFFGQF